jgi:hypothetical protein
VPGGTPTSPRWQRYNGFNAFSQNFLLKPDLDPAANDNTPAFMN